MDGWMEGAREQRERESERASEGGAGTCVCLLACLSVCARAHVKFQPPSLPATTGSTGRRGGPADGANRRRKPAATAQTGGGGGGGPGSPRATTPCPQPAAAWLPTCAPRGPGRGPDPGPARWPAGSGDATIQHRVDAESYGSPVITEIRTFFWARKAGNRLARSESDPRRRPAPRRAPARRSGSAPAIRRRQNATSFYRLYRRRRPAGARQAAGAACGRRCNNL